MDSWTPDIEVTAPLARRLIESQFPALRIARLDAVAEGWDNTVFRVNDSWLFRFPRRQLAIDGVLREREILPLLAGRLPAPVPLPAFQGTPSADFPWPFFGYRELPGKEVCAVELIPEARVRLVGELAGFLRHLHGPEIREDLGVRLPRDPFARADMKVRIPKTLTALADVKQRGIVDEIRPWEALVKAAGHIAPEPKAVVHGDLHFRHWLSDELGELRGVLDWGDICVGDPAMDLQMYWSFCKPVERPVFAAAYGSVRADTMHAARVIAIFVAASLAAWASARGQAAVLAEATAGLWRALED